LIPNFADEPEGFGTILIGALLFSGFALDVALLVAFGVTPGFGLVVALLVGRTGLITSPSLTVTLIFWPGFKFSIPTFAFDPVVFGLIATFLDEVGDGAALGFTVEVGAAEGFGDAFGEACGEVVGFGDGETVGFGDGLGVAEGVGVADGDGVGDGVGVADGEGVGDGVGDGDGTGTPMIGAGAPPPPDDCDK
jgi:hypothetical protein